MRKIDQRVSFMWSNKNYFCKNGRNEEEEKLRRFFSFFLSFLMQCDAFVVHMQCPNVVVVIIGVLEGDYVRPEDP